MNPRTASSSTSLWPREHGAYVELLAPLLTAMAFARPTWAGVWFALSACAAFLAHEPLLVLLGRRGPKRQSEQHDAAFARVWFLGTVALSCLGAAVVTAGASVVPAVTLSMVFVAGAFAFVAMHRERTLVGELWVAATLTSFGVPALVAGGETLTRALVVGLAWMAIHVVATLTARAFVYRKRGEHHLLGWAMATALMVLAGGALLSGHAGVPVAWCLTPAPFAAITAALSFGIYEPRTPRPLGYLLMTASIASFLLFGVGFHGLV